MVAFVTDLGIEPKLSWFKAKCVAYYTTPYFGVNEENRTPTIRFTNGHSTIKLHTPFCVSF